MHQRNRYRGVHHDFAQLAEQYPSLREHLIVKPPRTRTQEKPGRKKETHHEKPRVTYNFDSPTAVSAFTCALIHRDFGLSLTLPQGRLVPTLPQKLNYLHWIEDLLTCKLQSRPGTDDVLKRGFDSLDIADADADVDAGADTDADADADDDADADAADAPPRKRLRVDAIVDNNPTPSDDESVKKQMHVPKIADDMHTSQHAQIQINDRVTGIDIGTGASCIYALLGAKLHDNWDFVATDIDELSFTSAAKNVEDNQLGHRIKVVRNSKNAKATLNCVVDFSTQSYDFVMCNPPFFNIGETPDNRTGNRRDTANPCPGGNLEMETDGGEVGFVRRMIADSLALRGRVKWYTSMLGKKSSLDALKVIMRENNIPTIKAATLQQGNTHRWVIAWSLLSFCDSNTTSASPKELAKKSVDKPKEKSKKEKVVSRDLFVNMSANDAIARLKNIFTELADCTISQTDLGVLRLSATKPSWTGQRRERRKKMREEQQQQASEKQLSEKDEGRDCISTVDLPVILELAFDVHFGPNTSGDVDPHITTTKIRMTLGSVGTAQVFHQVVTFLQNRFSTSPATATTI